MNVLEIINSLGTRGGAETFSVALSKALNEKCKLSVVILYKNNNKELLDELNEAQISPIVLDKRHSVDFGVSKRLRKIIEERKIDVIHTENNALFSAFFGIIFMHKKPTLFHTFHLPAAEERRDKFGRILERRILKRKYVTPIALSERMAKNVKEFYHFSYVPSINNGVDLSRFFPGVSLSKRIKKCVIFARFTKQKNYPFVLDVFEETHKLDPSISFEIYGMGELEEEIKKLVYLKGLTNSVAIKGITQCPENVMRESRVVFLGSSYEAFPMVLIEAMACGCIVVSTDVDGVSDAVENGKNGFLYSPFEDPSTLAKKLTEIENHPDEFQSISDYNGQYSKKFSIDFVADNYLSLFQKNEKRN